MPDLATSSPQLHVASPSCVLHPVQDTDTPSLGHMAHHLVNVPKWDAWKMLPQVCLLPVMCSDDFFDR